MISFFVGLIACSFVSVLLVDDDGRLISLEFERAKAS
jgi:hypothetical protein